MENKYYTPSLEEFCVGFRYESKSLKKDEWFKNIATIEDLKEIEIAVKYEPTIVRVKYLNKTDIEELDWINSVETQWYLKTEKHLPNYINYTLTKHNNIIVIKWHHPDDSKGEVVFRGVIKNYNELQKLMQMLEI